MFLIIAVFLTAGSFSVPVSRMDLFDKSGNSLLFVEFDYDSTGKNTGRSIYASDSTFLRKTTFTDDASGKRTREQSFNFNDDTIGYTLFSSQNDKPAISVFDQFNLNMFGANVSYALNGANTYDVYHNDRVVYKMKYSLPEGTESGRIDILDNSSALLYYATLSYSGLHAVNHSKVTTLQQSMSLFRDRCQLTLSLQKKSYVKVCLYNLSGKLVSVPFQGNLNNGLQTVQFKIGLPSERKLASNLYIIRLYVDGGITAYSQKFIANTGRR